MVSAALQPTIFNEGAKNIQYDTNTAMFQIDSSLNDIQWKREGGGGLQ